MANTNLNVRVALRTDTESNWSANNPILLKGEIAIVNDRSGMFKVGDGTTSWASLEYNAASKWETTRNFTIGSTKKAVDGSADVSWTLTEIGAAAISHTHAYIPLSGSASITGDLEFAQSQTTTRGIIGCIGGNDYWRVVGGATASDAGFLEIATADGGTEPIYVRQYSSGKFTTLKRTATLLDSSGNTTFPGSITGSSVIVDTETISGVITSGMTTSTYLAGNQGQTIINSTASAGAYTMLAKLNSTNGYFTTGVYQTKYLLQYTLASTVTASTNSVTKSVTLLDESGNSSFPGTITATTFVGSLSGNASTATILQTTRTINGTSFNGSANITTSYWGTTRNIYITDSTSTNTGAAVSVNGSADSILKLPATIKAALAGNASTATTLQTARTITLAGAVTGSVSFNGSADVTLTAIRRSCYVGQSSSTSTNPYYKFASFTTSTSYDDAHITFHVWKGYGDASTGLGILTAHFRRGSSTYFENGQLVWEYANPGITVGNFIMAYSATSDSTIVELWVNIPASYTFYHFDVISEGNRTTNSASKWTLYNTSSAGSQSAVTSDYTQITSTLNTIINPIDGGSL